MRNDEDRGMMKWQAFHSVISEDEINKNLKNRIINEKPEFSEDQINELERLIIEAFNSGSTITLTIYGKSKNTFVTGVITKLDSHTKSVYVNKKPYNFTDILNIKFE